VGFRRLHLAPCALLFCLALAAPARAATPLVLRCELDGAVGAGSSEYLRACVTEAESRGADALLIRLDTPGGALESTREIVGAFLGSPVPILLWVGPSGARAGSAGVFLTLAANLAGMAPGTNIGAAHPVSGPGGRDPEESGGQHMARKVENDTAAFVEAIAEQRGRNVKWAISAVRESASVTAERALALNVIDLLAPSEEAFLHSAHGREVTVGEETRTLSLKDARVETLEPTLRQRVVHWLANPAVAYVLFLVGALGLAIELSNPGLVVPGLLGLTAMVLAMVAMSALPVQAGAVVLLALGLGMLAAEFFVGNGMLAVGGLLLMALGGVLFVDRLDPAWFVEPNFHLPLRTILPTVVVLGGVAAYLARRAAQTRKVSMKVGDLGMLGEVGQALTEVGPQGGQVMVHGELWRARAQNPIPPEKRVVVRGLDGLTVLVEEAAT
jgi:membrane-bound serine protease (ClpP class)